MTFGNLYDNYRRFFAGTWAADQQQYLTALRDLLNDGTNPIIRMWVDGTPGTGHQTSTINLLRQLANPVQRRGFDYQGTVEVWYNPQHDTLDKLYKLLPELQQNPRGQVLNATVELYDATTTSPGAPVTFGFSGGADSDTVPYTRLAQYFLRIQPYLWPAPERIEIENQQPVVLTEQPSLRGPSFKQLAYYISAPEPNWALYGPTSGLQEQAELVRRVTNNNQGWDICPVYSIRSAPDMQLADPASDRMFEVIVGALASQRSADNQPLNYARPVLVISCDAFDSAEQQPIDNLLGGGYNVDENDLLAQMALIPVISPQYARAQAALQPARIRARWLRDADAVNRVRYNWPNNRNRLERDLDWLFRESDRVLFLQLGRVPAELFNWLLARAGWPAVFEGQNTAMVALNVGKPYFHVTREGGPSFQYPNTIIGVRVRGEVLDPFSGQLVPTWLPVPPVKFQIAANKINTPVYQWLVDNNPAEGVGSLVRTYRTEAPNGELHTYFEGVRNFYQNANNDKFRVAATFFYGIQFAGRTLSAREVGAPSVLEALLGELTANLIDGTLRIAPGALDEGGIFTFYTRFLGAERGLILSDANIEPDYTDGELTAITTTGSISIAGIALGARIVFTQVSGVVVAHARFTREQRWAIDGIPWLGFSSPFVEARTAQVGFPLSGAVGGTIEGADLELAFRLPVDTGKWQLAGAFEPPYPSIARAFQLAGGVNLVRSLPAPFDGLAGFGLQEVEIVYDEEAGAVEGAAFRFATSEGFRLLGDIHVREVAARVMVQRPGDLPNRSIDWAVTAAFALGSGEDAAVIALSANGPGLILRGSLTSGVLRFADIVAAFAPGTRLDLPAIPQITGFAFAITPDTGDYEVSCALNIAWPVYAGDTLVFSIDDIGFAVSRRSLGTSVNLRGGVTIGSGENAVPLRLSAVYQPNAGWTFLVAQSPDSVVNLSVIANQFLPDSWRIDHDYGIKDLGMRVNVGTGADRANSWELTGRTAEPWQVPFISGLSVAAALRLGYTGGATGAGWAVRLETTWTWQQISILVFFDYAPDRQRYGIVWGGLEGLVEGPDKNGDWTATLRLRKGTTVGSLVETMVSWITGSPFALEAPWSLLNSIPLDGLSLIYTFNRDDPTRDSVAFGVDVGPIDLGIARIDRITVRYNSRARERVAVTLEGSFPWNVGDGATGDTGTLGPWDASKPGAAPAPPGAGGKYLDLRLLALGQHVAAPGLSGATTIQKAIELIRALPSPEPGKLPAVRFDPASGWLIGLDLGILRFGDQPRDGAPATSGHVVTAQLIFNDPTIYGLRLALAGDAAKVFKGLDFQIMYRQVTETVGVYQAEIALPDVMRHLSIGAYSLTLPVFGIAVYTNGDFQIDVGFPWQEDFSRSFTIEGIIYPGIPMLGSAGFYVGKLSSATSDRVPKISNGTFNPVLVFGLGLQIGFGKSLQYGPLKAGFSVTAVGIIEGVIARFNAYQPDGGGDVAQVQDSYYFWLRGTFGIIGRLYGSVDFAVVKADVNVSLSLLVQITYESFVSLAFSVIVAVDVSVAISINVGLFSIRISFRFSMRLKETFTLDNTGTPPWRVIGQSTPHSLSGPADRRLGHRRAPSPGIAAAAAAADRWQRLLPAPDGVTPLTGWLVPGTTLAHDERDTSGDPTRQLPCQVYLAMLETVPSDEGTVAEVVAATAAAAADTSFESLAMMVLRWVVAAGQSDELTPEAVDQHLVSAADLTYLLDTVLVSTDAEPAPIRPADVDGFLSRQFRLTLGVPDGQPGEADATPFPMPPMLRLTAPAYGTSYAGYEYVFADYNALDDAVAARLRAYFDELAVRTGPDNSPSAGPRRSPAGTMSMAEWVQADYFLLLARQMTQAALDGLRDFRYVLDDTMTVTDIVTDVNTTGQLVGDDRVTEAGLFVANPRHLLTAGRRLTIGATHAPGGRESFERIATTMLGGAVSALELARANAAEQRLLRPGAVITYGDARYVVAAGDSLLSVARHFGVRFGELLGGAATLLTDDDLLVPGVSLLVPLITCQVAAGASFETVAASAVYASGGVPGFTATALATRNAGRPVLRVGTRVTYRDRTPYEVRGNDCLSDVAAAFEVTLPELLAGSDVLTSTRLLADVTVLVLPAFEVVTGEGDTLAALAERFATSVDVLALAPANFAVVGLFATRDATGAATPDTAWLDVPHLARYPVGALLEEARRTLAIRQLSRMSGRYALHGTRLPTTGIVPKARGMWVDGRAPALSLPELAGLYALTGQQIDVPLVDQQGGAFTVRLSRAAGPTWLTFPDDAEQLAVTLAPGSPDATRLSEIVVTGTARPFDIGATALGADPMYERRPAVCPLTTRTDWRSAAPVRLPYGPPPGERTQELRLWSLPSALTGLLAARPVDAADAAANLPADVTPPRFSVRLATYDEATGGTVVAAAGSYAWATVVRFTVRRVPRLDTSPTTATTYEIVGAGGPDVPLLERLVDQLGSDDAAIDRLTLAFPPESTTATAAGLATDPTASVTLGIAQTSLATDTRPPGVAAADTQLTAADGLLNPPTEFIRLLWEASITRDGGFYLYYYDTADGRGLPDWLFNDRGEAEVSLLVLHASPTAEADRDRVHDYLTAVVTGDAFDTARTTVFAEAAPMEPAAKATRELSLAALARRTYSDIADLAAANRESRLAAGVRLTVTGAVYQAPVAGVRLAAIVTAFGLGGVAALNAANPRWSGGLPDPLAYPAAIFLPEMTLTVGSSAHTASLADIAAYYGVDLATLAACNAEVAGVFAEGQDIVVPGGPYGRVATVPPGAVAVGTRREQPADTPPAATPPSADQARLFLLNTFTMLGYRVAANVFFRRSELGLPAGPTPPPTGDTSLDKVRVAPDSDVWEYHQSFGYPRFAVEPAATPAGLPPADGDPYRGLGGILQVDFGWQDHYGNTLVTTLTSPPADTAPANQPPMPTGYTDALLAVGQWPAIATDWRVTGAVGDARLEVSFGFDTSRYQGLVSATATGATTIMAAFTARLDPGSATRLSGYRLESVDSGDGNEVEIVAVSLGGDQRTVTITTGRPLAGLEYRLSVSGVLGVSGVAPAEQPSYTGWASFVFPEAPDRHSSSVTEAAARDLAVYASLYYQLNDTNGVAVTVATSLLTRSLDIDGERWSKLLGWLFTEPASIYAYLADRSAGGTGIAAPASPHVIALPFATADVNGEQIFRLSLSLTLRRLGGAVLPGLETTAGVRAATTMVAPRTARLEPDGQAGDGSDAASASDTVGLPRFAQDFEAVLRVPGRYRLKVASGVDRTEPAAGGTATLWAVRLGDVAAENLSYRITNPGAPALFAPRPLSNQLAHRAGVPIYDYTTGQGISELPTRQLDFVGIDMDVWVRTLLSAVDDVLTPEYTGAIRIVSAKTGDTDSLRLLLEQKKLLADAISTLMIPLYEGEHADPALIREAFRQRLLSRLSHAYDTRAGIQFDAAVDAADDETTAAYPPRLFGPVLDRRATGERRGEISLTSPKLPLRRTGNAALPFLLAAPETVDQDGAVVGAIDLDLVWAADSIEHQITEPRGIEGYLASSWLSFVVPDDTATLSQPLGAFPVPLVLRSFPTTPTMLAQTAAVATPDTNDLATITEWAYTFSWSLPFHYPQDRVRGVVEFNVRTVTEAADAPDVFPALAQFVTVYPSVREDLRRILAPIDVNTTDPRALTDAAIAVGSLVDLLRRVTSAAAGPAGLVLAESTRSRVGQSELSYAFEVTEGSVTLPDPTRPHENVTALLVTITGTPPAGVGTPKVLVAPDTYRAVRYTGPGAPEPVGVGAVSYYYVDRDTTAYLSRADGQKIPERAVTLPGLDVLSRQDALAEIWLTRNERILEDRPPIAEPFVYTTPEVRPADPLLPAVDSSARIPLSRLGPDGPVRPLDRHLAALFAELFHDLPAGVDRVTIQVETVYRYQLNPLVGPVELPIFLQAPLLVSVADEAGDDTTLAWMIANWAETITAWFAERPPNPAEGTLRFDLRILTNLTDQPMPLLRLRELQLDIADVVPRLATS